MASILSLPDDCLHKIVSFIEDPSSFHSIALTCQRFLQVTKNATSVVHSNILRTKVEYLIKCCIVEIRTQARRYYPYNCYREGCYLIDLLQECARLTTRKNTLTYEKVVDVWQRNGPVAAKLLTWVRKYIEPDTSAATVMNDMNTFFDEKRNMTLHLPSCKRSMVIQTWCFGAYSHEIVPRLHIQITCGDLTVESFDYYWSSNEAEYFSWEGEEVKRIVVEPMTAVVELLQKELGETVPPITDDFFVWLCFLFPDKANLTEGNRLRFKDDTRNTKPTHPSLQTAIAEFHKELQFENGVEKQLTYWNTQFEWESSKYAEMMTETIRQLSKRSEARILERLGGDAFRFCSIANSRDLYELPNNVLLDLFLRTSLEASTFKPATIATKNVESRVFFKCSGSKVMKVCGSIHGNGKLYPSWETLQLEFTLPDGKVLNLDAPLDLETLSPVRDLLQECFNSTMQGKQTKINNFRTAVYFLHALELSSASLLAFDSLERFPESEEESDNSEYNDYSSSPEYGEND